MNVELGRLIRYGIVGGLTACLYFGTVGTAVEVFDMPPVAASVLAQLVTIAAAYYGHAIFSFQVQPDCLYLARFMFMAVTGILLNIAVVWLLNVLLKIPYAAAIAAVAILIPLYTFLCNRFWVFLAGLESSLVDEGGGLARTAKPPKTDGAQ